MPQQNIQSGKDIKLLIIDDDSKITNLLNDYLSELGYDVSVAYDGAQAATLYNTQAFDLALIDIFMPEKDGLEVISELKKKCPETKAITMSGMLTTDTYLNLSKKLGSDASIAKPFDLIEISSLIENTLQR